MLIQVVATVLLVPFACDAFQATPLVPFVVKNLRQPCTTTLHLGGVEVWLDPTTIVSTVPTSLLQPYADTSLLSLLGIESFDSGKYALVWTILGSSMLAWNTIRYRDLPQSTWRPGPAWTRALVYFSGCNVFASVSGTTQALLSQPLWTSGQLLDPMWQQSAVGCTIYILIAYWGVWSRNTLTFDRQRYIGAALVFGLLWGLSTGQLLLSFYHLWNSSGMQGWTKYLLSYACMGGWQYVIQDYWWDIYISPEHDTPQSILVKICFCHIPNVALCLAFLNYYDNYTLFVVWQTLALVAASIFQRFPTPWAQGKFNAPMTQPGLFGLSRGLGYSEELL